MTQTSDGKTWVRTVLEEADGTDGTRYELCLRVRLTAPFVYGYGAGGIVRTYPALLQVNDPDES